MPRLAFLVILSLAAACGGPTRPPLTAPDPYESYAVEEHSITEPPDWKPEESPFKGRLWRFDLDRGSTRNGAGFTVIARETPSGGRVVALEFDGVLILDEQHEGSGFGGVALVAFDDRGKLLWSRKLDGDKYHYVKALEVTA